MAGQMVGMMHYNQHNNGGSKCELVCTIVAVLALGPGFRPIIIIVAESHMWMGG